MDLFSYLIVFLIIFLFIVLLPLISGIGSYKFVRSSPKNERPEPIQISQDQGYIPIEEKLRKEQESNKKESKFTKLKNLKVTKESVPLKFTTSSNLKLNSNTLRNRKTRDLDSLNNESDPNAYDYDLDELINEADNDENSENEYIQPKNQNDLENLA